MEPDVFVSLAIIWMGKNVFILLMEEILHQLMWRVIMYLMIYMQGFMWFYTGGAGILPSTVTVVDEHGK